MSRWTRLWALALVIFGACADADSSPGSPERQPDAVPVARDASGAIVDSSFPPAEQMRRFRATIADSVTVWRGGAGNRDALVRRFVEAVAAADTTALLNLAMSRAEFAYLYYDASPLSRDPTRLDPALAWFIIEQNGAKGLTRVLRRFGGRLIDYRDYDCPEPPRSLGAARVWEQCAIRYVDDGVETSGLWFGGILESRGTFKFVSYANGF